MASKRAAKTPLSSEPQATLRTMQLRSRRGGTSDADQDENFNGAGRGRGIEKDGENGRVIGQGRGHGRGSGLAELSDVGMGGGGRGRGRVVGQGPGNVVTNIEEEIGSESGEPGNNLDSSSNDQIANIEDQECYSVDQMLQFARQKYFPKKNVFFGDLKRKYSPVLHFFEHKNEFNEKLPDDTKIDFICKFGKCKKTASFGGLTNLNKHLKAHEKTKEWYERYIQCKKKCRLSNSLPEAKLNLIKFFITSNMALKQLENVYLRKCLKEEIKIPCFKTFRYTFLNEIMKLLHDKIENKCKEASFITLIPDCWSDDANTHLLGTNIAFQLR